MTHKSPLVGETVAALCGQVAPLATEMGRLAALRLRTLARPPGALGRLDDLVSRIAMIRGEADPGPLPSVVSVIAADHGLARQGTSVFPQEVGGHVLELIQSGRAPVNIIAESVSARVTWADFGLVNPLGDQKYKVAPGTRDIRIHDAMTLDQAEHAILRGACYARERLGTEPMVAVGEIGIGNTTAAAALTARMLDASPRLVVGPGSGIDRLGVQRKRELVERALQRVRGLPHDPLALLAALGGFEIAGNVGVILAAAAERKVVVLDGFITGVAALLAVRLRPETADYLIAAHRSAEPGHAPLLETLGLEPLLALGLRLGMGSGAALALGLINTTLTLAQRTPRARDVGLAMQTKEAR